MSATSVSVQTPLGRLSVALQRAAVLAGLGQLLKRRRARLTLAISIARCFHSFGMGILMTSSLDLLYKLARANKQKACKNEDEQVDGEGGSTNTKKSDDGAPQSSDLHSLHQRVQRIQTNIGTVVMLIDYFTGPLLGSCIDRYGRMPAMIVGLGLPGLMRLFLTCAPSLNLYFCYRVLVALVGNAWGSSSGAALSDMYGRGTQELSVVGSSLSRYELVSQIAGTFFGRMIPRYQHGFLLCGFLQVAAAGVITVGMQETMPASNPSPLSLRRLSPLSFIPFFRKSRALTALAIIKLIYIVGSCNVHEVFRRQKFANWGRVQESRQMNLVQIAAFFATLMKVRMMDVIGLEASTRLHSLLHILLNLNSAFAPRMELLHLNPSFLLLMCGGESVDRCLQQEAQILSLGPGELGAAQGTMAFFPNLIMPHVYTGLYSKFASTFPTFPYCISTVLHLFAAVIVTPWAFAQLSRFRRGLQNRSVHTEASRYLVNKLEKQ